MVKYGDVSDLPDGVQDNLPQPAQHIYMSAYNSAVESDTELEGDQSREQYAHRVAWTAVKQEYEKGDSHWHKKEDA